MMEYSDLSTEEMFEVYNKAFTFLHDHADHVHNMIKKDTPCVAPSGRDCYRIRWCVVSKQRKSKVNFSLERIIK